MHSGSTSEQVRQVSHLSSGELLEDEFMHEETMVKKKTTRGSTSTPVRKFVSQRSVRARKRSWICDWRTWASVAATLSMIGVGVWRLLLNESDKLAQLREEVESIGETYATALAGQVRTSTSSVHALAALLKVDNAGLVSQNFETVAGTLRDSLKGITNLQLAPYGTVKNIHPLVSEEYGLDSSGAIGHALLLDPGRIGGSVDTIESQSILMIGPLKLLQGGVAVIARLPVFSRFADPHLPTEEFAKNGEVYKRNCSDLPPEECKNFEGPDHEDGNTTYFWGFATMLTLVDELLEPLQLRKLESDFHLSRAFHYQLRDAKVHTSMRGSDGVFAHSANAGPSAIFDDPVNVSIVVEELGVSWALSLVPEGGWPAVSPDFWIQVALLTVACAMTGTAAAFMILSNVRGAYKRIQKLEDFKLRKRKQLVCQAVEDIDRIRFPMCVMTLRMLGKLGKLISHEEAREKQLLKFLDTAEDMRSTATHTAFFSHQWSGFAKPDHCNSQYKSIVHAGNALRESGMPLKFAWVDYFSIPQRNRDTQQNAIDSLAVYATHCRVFVAVVPNCQHFETGMPVNVESYSRRAWCRLEQLAFLSATSHSSTTRCNAFRCDGEGELKPLWGEGITEQTSLDVMFGEFSCCARGHPDMMPCDRTKVVGVMLGTLWRMKDRASQGADDDRTRAHGLLKTIDSDTDRFFPPELDYVSVDDGNGGLADRRELFGDSVQVLSDMFASGHYSKLPSTFMNHVPEHSQPFESEVSRDQHALEDLEEEKAVCEQAPAAQAKEMLPQRKEEQHQQQPQLLLQQEPQHTEPPQQERQPPQQQQSKQQQQFDQNPEEGDDLVGVHPRPPLLAL